MLLSILMSILSSEMTKQLIGLGVKKLLDHSSDGITKDVANVMLSGIAASQSNNADLSVIDIVKKAL